MAALPAERCGKVVGMAETSQESLSPSRREVLAGFGAAVVAAGVCSVVPALAEEPATGADGAAGSDSASGSDAVETVVWHDPNVVGNWPESGGPGDDFAVYVSRDWHERTELPEGRSRWTAFGELTIDVKQNVIDLLESAAETHDEQTVSSMFDAALDWGTRDAAGLSPVSDTLEALLGACSVDDIANLYLTDGKLFLHTPLLNAYVQPDLLDSSTMLAGISPATLSMNDSAEYTGERTATGERRRAAKESFALGMLGIAGVDEAEARQMVEDLFAFEERLARFICPVADSYRDDWIRRCYNIYTRDELAALCPGMPLLEILDAAGLAQAERFNVDEPTFVEGLGGLFAEENFAGLRAYLVIGLLSDVARFADSASEDAYIAYTNAVEGSTGKLPEKERAYNLVKLMADELVGAVYGRRFFDDESRADVEGILETLLDTFELRLETADWLGEETRTTALEKVRTMTRRIGYPVDDFQYAWEELDLAPRIEAGASLLDLYVYMAEWKGSQDNAKAGQPANHGVWPMSGAEVNACYEPTDNSITFPAAILRSPIYDKSRSASANYGAVGAVIGHEITHAFDKTGSQFDAQGNLVDWWSEEDRAAFTERTSHVRNRYASIEVWDGVHCDGDLTAGETVADLGGLACALQIVDGLEDRDYEEFFTAYATLWGEILTPEMRLYYLKNDPHAPSYLRANITCQQFQQFYDTFGVREGDFMFVPEDERLKVW